MHPYKIQAVATAWKVASQNDIRYEYDMYSYCIKTIVGRVLSLIYSKVADTKMQGITPF